MTVKLVIVTVKLKLVLRYFFEFNHKSDDEMNYDKKIK